MKYVVGLSVWLDATQRYDIKSQSNKDRIPGSLVKFLPILSFIIEVIKSSDLYSNYSGLPKWP